MTTTSLTPVQHATLAKAINTSSDKIDWFPDNTRDGTRKKVLDGVFSRALTINDDTDWFATAEGYDALGMRCPDATPPIPEVDAELEHAVATTEATWTPASTQARPCTRDNSKQAEVIRMPQRPEGVTIGRICTAAGWQAHTVCGTFTGTFKKKLGPTTVSDKLQGGERVYRIA